MNRNEYKRSLSSVGPTDKTVEKIMDIPERKKSRINLIVMKVACAALSVAIVVGGIFGINYNSNTSEDDFSVMVVYAYDNKSLHLGSKNSQKLFYGIYTAPLDDKEACDEVRNRWHKDKSDILSWIDDERDDDEYASISSGSEACYSESLDKETAVFYTLDAGNIELSLEDYSQVKTFKVENISDYGYLEFDYCTEDEYREYEEATEKIGNEDGEIVTSDDTIIQEISDITNQDIMDILAWSHKFEISGDELRFSQKSGFYTKGLGEYEENKGYYLNWVPSFELKSAIGENPNFDLTQIVDTITFTVEYMDSTVKTASMDLYFDKDGYMRFNK